MQAEVVNRKRRCDPEYLTNAYPDERRHECDWRPLKRNNPCINAEIATPRVAFR
jgi:hypothetical protein